MLGAPERLPAFVARTFSTVITTSVVQDLTLSFTGQKLTHFKFTRFIVA
jgi:hypothetical protein